MSVTVHNLVIPESTTVTKYMKLSNGGSDVDEDNDEKCINESSNDESERRIDPQELVDEEVKMKAIVLQESLHLKEEKCYIYLGIWTIHKKEDILKEAEEIETKNGSGTNNNNNNNDFEDIEDDDDMCCLIYVSRQSKNTASGLYNILMSVDVNEAIGEDSAMSGNYHKADNGKERLMNSDKINETDGVQSAVNDGADSKTDGTASPVKVIRYNESDDFLRTVIGGKCNTANFIKYYGQVDYGDRWITALFNGMTVDFNNGNTDFYKYDYDVKTEVIKKGSVTTNVFMYVIRKCEDDSFNSTT